MAIACRIDDCPCHANCDLKANAPACATWRVNRGTASKRVANADAAAKKRAKLADANKPIREVEYMKKVISNAASLPPFLSEKYIDSRLSVAGINPTLVIIGGKKYA